MDLISRIFLSRFMLWAQFILGLGLFIFCLQYWVLYEAPTEAEVKTLTGQLKKAETVMNRKKDMISKFKIILDEHSTQFVVSRALRKFKLKAFKRDVPIGSEVKLTVRKEEWANPITRPGAPEPFVFLLAVQAYDQDYLTMEQYVASDKENAKYFGYLSLALLAYVIFISLVLCFKKK